MRSARRFGIPTKLFLPLIAALVVALSGAPTRKQAPRIEALVLDVETVSRTDLDAALDLRLPDRPRMPAGNPKTRKQYALYGYVQIRRSEGGVALALILSDGRSYNRELQGEPELLPRIVASQLANLIAGIEADTLAPDEEDVAIPDATEPAKAVVPAPVVAPPRPRAAAPQPDLGLRIGGGVLLGVPPPAPAGVAAGGGEVGLEFRSVHGALAGLSVRGASRVDSGFALVRVRVAALGGYAYRRGDFELVAAAGITVEPFFVQRNGGREALARNVGDEQRAAFLLGGVARVAPGFRRTVTPCWNSSAWIRWIHTRR